MVRLKSRTLRRCGLSAPPEIRQPVLAYRMQLAHDARRQTSFTPSCNRHDESSDEDEHDRGEGEQD